jgi:hypothetical protein
MDQIWIQRTKNSVIVAVHAVKVIWGGLVHISNVVSSIWKAKTIKEMWLSKTYLRIRCYLQVYCNSTQAGKRIL